MSVPALSGKFVQAKGFTLGRTAPVRLVAVHTAEGSRTNDSLGAWWRGGGHRASSNAGIDDLGYAEFVTYNNTPWTNPPVNSVADTVELCAFKAWSRTEWLNHKAMLETLAHWIAWRCSVRGLPIQLLTPAQIANGGKGVVDHFRINQTYHKSDHTDVGANFPWDVVIPRAQEIAGLKVGAKVVQPATQMAGKDRWLGLYNPPLTGADVAGVQNAIRLCGNDITIDGIYDRETADLVAVFQQHRDISERGVGPHTWSALRAVPGVHS